MSVRKQILDPLSTLCKIASLTFYNNGSKIGIYNNTIGIQKLETASEWAIRKIRRDSQENISLIYNPIVKAIQWYIFQQRKKSIDIVNNDNPVLNDHPIESAEKRNSTNLTELDTSTNPTSKLEAIKNIMRFAIEGLRKLRSTYKEGIVVIALQLLINNLKMAISDEPNIIQFEEYNEIINFAEDGILNYDKIKEIWNTDTIQNISNQFTLCDKNKYNSVTLGLMLDSLNLMLEDADIKFKKLVTDMNATL